VWFSGPVSIW